MIANAGERRPAQDKKHYKVREGKMDDVDRAYVVIEGSMKKHPSLYA